MKPNDSHGSICGVTLEQSLEEGRPVHGELVLLRSWLTSEIMETYKDKTFVFFCSSIILEEILFTEMQVNTNTS